MDTKTDLPFLPATQPEPQRCAPPNCALSSGSALGTLPEDWVCKECGKPAWQYASIAPIAEACFDDRATIEEYGAGCDMFTDGVEIEICGYCGGSARWSPPNTELTQ